MQRIEMIGLDLENRGVELLGLRKHSQLVKFCRIVSSSATMASLRVDGNNSAIFGAG